MMRLLKSQESRKRRSTMVAAYRRTGLWQSTPSDGCCLCRPSFRSPFVSTHDSRRDAHRSCCCDPGIQHRLLAFYDASTHAKLGTLHMNTDRVCANGNPGIIGPCFSNVFFAILVHFKLSIFVTHAIISIPKSRR